MVIKLDSPVNRRCNIIRRGLFLNGMCIISSLTKGSTDTKMNMTIMVKHFTDSSDNTAHRDKT